MASKKPPALPPAATPMRAHNGQDLYTVGLAAVTGDRHVRVGPRVWDPVKALQVAADMAAAATLALAPPSRPAGSAS